MVIQPLEAWAKIGTSPSHWVKVNRLAGFVCLYLEDRRVKVQDMHTLRPLAFENRTNLGLKESQLPRVHRAGAVDSDRDLPDALAYHSRQVETCPDMAAVGAHPAIVSRYRIRPEPP
jgi:hypothetical protein